MSSGSPLSAEAVTLLRYCVEHERQVNDWFTKETLAKQFGLSLEQVFEAMDSLELRSLVKSQSDHGMWSVTLQGRELVDNGFQRPSATHNTFTFTGPVHGNVIGTSTGTVTSNYVFNELEREIDRHGGDDVDELKEIAREILDRLKDQDTLHQGDLSQFSAAIERHSWFTGAIAQAVLAWATGNLLG